MKIKRFIAGNTKTAMRMVKEEQGPNAVILSMRRVDSGIELVAATDYDEALVQQTLRTAAEQDGLPSDTSAEAGNAEGRLQQFQVEVAETVDAPAAQSPLPLPETWEHLPDIEVVRAPVRKGARTKLAKKVAEPRVVMGAEFDHGAYKAAMPETNLNEIKSLRKELAAMKYFVSSEIRKLSDIRLRVAAGRESALDHLLQLGVEADYARTLVAHIPEDADAKLAQSLMIGLLAKNLVVSNKDPVINGGILALVGPTGVGKTTTIAKLASRFAERHGPRNVALLTTDNYRVGAREQLYTYGRLLGMPVIEANTGEELTAQIERLAEYKLLLIDTAGMSPRDRRLSAQLKWLNGSRRLQTYLVLAANAQWNDMDAAVRCFKATKLSGTILTKLDETNHFGAALSIATKYKLDVAYVSDGQRVPEDLHVCQPHHLVLRAMMNAQEVQHNANQEEVDHVAA